MDNPSKFTDGNGNNGAVLFQLDRNQPLLSDVPHSMEVAPSTCVRSCKYNQARSVYQHHRDMCSKSAEHHPMPHTPVQ